MKVTTQQLFATHNKKLLTDIMEKDEPVLCDSFSDKYDDVINYTIEENGLQER